MPSPNSRQSDAADAPYADGWDLWFHDAYEVSSEAVRAFARATRDPHIAYAGRGILAPDCPVPITLLAAPMFDAAAALVSRAIPNCNLSRIVHAAQQFTALDALRIGQRISIGARLSSHVVKAGTDIITIDTTAYADDAPRLAAVLTIAHSDSAGPAVDLDSVADHIMLTGTGPSDSNAYTSSAR
ncbi:MULTISPECIES: MaoC family dehydratase N-terminal domain-containing protein [Tsukamurella]|uniref:MaoC family dehydratase n=2 Tax=Tsukamurella TaxID=2060 RepID=A0A5C5RSU2_9ACTN|nr:MULTISPECIES: MaoC family dehydratase N-terminal domain-containing protein [Tsukamurella]NMD56999.1 MaoC family dehydratase [Tsukamurella columbiensis]TWS25692.1 MaoC family dehydratase [Tsukamurella conjunctivitidis]